MLELLNTDKLLHIKNHIPQLTPECFLLAYT